MNHHTTHRHAVPIIIFIIILLISATFGCIFSNDPKKDDKREGFKLDDLADTTPLPYASDPQIIDTAPTLNSSSSYTPSVMAIWYFDQNTIYKEYGGTLKFLIKNNSTDTIYIYEIGIKPEWYKGGLLQNSGEKSVVGKYIAPDEKEYVGMIYFYGPKTTGKYNYKLYFSLYVRNDTGAWNDCGEQEVPNNSFEVVDLPQVSEYEVHYNLPQYYDKINKIVDPTNENIINLCREIASDFAGPFNIYQACAIFDYVTENVNYFSDPSNTENYWSTPEQTLTYGGDCEDHSTLLASMMIALGGSVRMYMTDSHAFSALYIGIKADVQDILQAIREYYFTDVTLFWFENDMGCWLVIDSIGSMYLGGLPLGAAPIKSFSSNTMDEYSWGWDFSETTNLFVTDIIPK